MNTAVSLPLSELYHTILLAMRSHRNSTKPLNNIDTAEWVLDFKQGSDQAFRIFFEKNFHNLAYFVWRIVNDWPAADDIAITAMNSCFSKCAEFANITTAQSYLYTAAKNDAINYVKLGKRRQRRNEVFSYTTFNDVDDEIEFIETINEIHEAIKRLPEDRRTIIELLYFDGLSPAAVASKLSISPNTVYVQKRRAEIAIKKIMIERLNKQ